MEKGKQKKKIGAVLVQGGGIAGVQASLDLANSGFKVYLVERDAAIGGMMAHLDKTFPTGDCATCIVSPKLVECARNLNIEILTLSELETARRRAGQFQGHREAVPAICRREQMHRLQRMHPGLPGGHRRTSSTAIWAPARASKILRPGHPQHLRHLETGHSPCKMKCPAHVNVQGYVQLIKKKEYLKAVNLIRERNPLSAICGRVCPPPCESECTRARPMSPSPSGC